MRELGQGIKDEQSQVNKLHISLRRYRLYGLFLWMTVGGAMCGRSLLLVKPRLSCHIIIKNSRTMPWDNLYCCFQHSALLLCMPFYHINNSVTGLHAYVVYCIGKTEALVCKMPFIIAFQREQHLQSSRGSFLPTYASVSTFDSCIIAQSLGL